MARESCIEHPKRTLFIVIKQSYVNLFAGDHALAALMYCFEHFTNIESDRDERDETSREDTWVEAPMLNIVHQCTGLYSERALKPRVLLLEKLGLIKIDRGRRGIASRYLLNCDKVNALIKSRYVFSEEEIAGCKIAPENESTGANSGAVSGAKTADVSILTKEIRSMNEEIPPTPSFATSQDLRICWEKTRGLPKLKPSERKQLSEWKWQMSVEDLGAALIRFAEWLKGVTHPIRSAVAIFMKDSPSWNSYRTVEKEQPVAAPGPAPETPTALIPTWSSDPLYGEYLFAAADKGKRISEPKAVDGYKIWVTLTPDQKQKSIADMRYLADAASKPEFIPSPVGHLTEKPWRVIRRDVPARPMTLGERNQAECRRLAGLA